MDRQFTSPKRRRLGLIVCGVGLLAACASAPTPQQGTAVAPADSEPTVPSTAPIQAEASLSRTSPAQAGHADDFWQTLANGDHLSASAGWLLLPVPRITDDLPVPDRAAIGGDEFPLFLPEIRADAVVRPGGAASVGRTLDSVVAEREDARASLLDDSGESSTSGLSGGVRVPADAFPLEKTVTSLVDEASASRDDETASPQSSDPDRGTASDVAAGVTVTGEKATIEPVMTAGVAEAGLVGLENSVENAVRPSAGRDRPSWQTRRAEVSSARDVVMRLPGSGWLYVGREYGDGTATLLAKRNVDGDDEFVFQFSDDGEYGLWFQQQNARTGELSNERLEISAVPYGATLLSVGALPVSAEVAGTRGTRINGAENVSAAGASDGREESLSGANGDAGAPPGGSVGQGQESDNAEIPGIADQGPPESASVALDAARAFGEAGDPEAALGAYLDATGVDPGDLDDDLLMEIAAVAYQAGNAPLAAEYWSIAAARGGAGADEARNRLYSLAVKGEEPEMLRTIVEELRSSDQLTTGRILDAGEAMERMGDGAEAAAYYSEALASGALADRASVLFRLAQILELPGNARDLKRSLGLYEEIVSQYPLSPHWEVSAARMEYIRRHFLDIR